MFRVGIFFVFVLCFVFVELSYGLDVVWKKLKENDRVELIFSMPIQTKVKRTALKKISVFVSSKSWAKEPKPSKKVFVANLNLIDSVTITPFGIDILISTSSFGFVSYYHKNKVYIDVFKDRLGKFWTEKKVAIAISKDKVENFKSASRGSGSVSNKTKPENRISSRQKTFLVRSEKNKPQKPQKTQNNSSKIASDSKDKKKQMPIAKVKKVPAKEVEYKGLWLRAPVKQRGYNNPFQLFVSATPVVKKKVQKKTPSKTKPSEQKKKKKEGSRGKKEEESKKELNPKIQLHQARVAFINGDYESAKTMYETLRAKKNLPPEVMIKVLYDLSDLYIAMYKDELEDHYCEVIGMLKEAFYYDPDYFRVPELITKLMWVNMQVGNFEEAMGYFSYLKQYYPKSPMLAIGLYYLGSYYFKEGKYDVAAKYLYQVVDKYPTSKFVKQASVKLAVAYEKLGINDKAWKLIEYIQKRWFRFYLEDPEFLKVAASVALKSKFYLKAKSFLWQYYNLYPEAKDSDVVLTHIGDCYLLLKDRESARKVYERVITLFPDREGSLIAKMRLAEEGIYDEFSLKSMFSVFDRPFNLKPKEVYEEIVKKHSKSPLAPLAQLKLISWYIWRGKYLKALKEVVNFKKLFPDSELKVEAEKLGKRALAKEVVLLVKNGIYAQAVSLWKKYYFLHKDIDRIDPQLPFAIALAMWKVGDVKDSIRLASINLKRHKEREIVENGLNLLLNIYVDTEQWKKVIELYFKFFNSGLNPYLKDQFRYAYALALENSNREGAFEIWKTLVTSKHLSEVQKGYVFYFLASHYLNKKNYESVYDYAQQALSVFIEKDKDKYIDKIKDCFNMLIMVTRITGRLLEAIEWAERYRSYVSRKDPLEWTFYRYRLAGLYREAGYSERWRKILEDLKENYSDTYYGKLAELDLEGLSLKSRVNKILR